MKHIHKILFVALAAALCSCQMDDANKDYGFAKVYIPQATVTGLDNTYPIPLGPFYQNSDYTCRYDAASGRLKIALGVIRSAYLSRQEAFRVNLGESREQTLRKLAEYEAKGIAAQALPSELCSFPSTIEVEAGTNGGTCYVEVDMVALARQRESLLTADGYKLLVLGLEISNPTRYELAESNTSVVIVLDLGSDHWDKVSSDKPESEIRKLFPII